ncbi:MAG: glycosyltransferase [Dehalococcoidia bacterium]
MLDNLRYFQPVGAPVMERVAVPDRDRVAAVVVTFNRWEILFDAIKALLQQSRPVDQIIVVDNNSSDGTAEKVEHMFPEVTCIRMVENTGPSGGFAVGMRRAVMDGADWVWVFNDDTTTTPDALEVCLAAAEGLVVEKAGVVCPYNRSGDYVEAGFFWRGKPVKAPLRAPTDEPYRVDLVTFNGALMSRRALLQAGFPRDNYFLGFEEWEHCLRIVKSGFEIWMAPQVVVNHLHEGSNPGKTPPWRGYYQTRNQLAMAMEHRSPRAVFSWGVRQVKFLGATVLHQDRKVERMVFRWRGTMDALRGRMGRTVDPAAYAMKQAARQAAVKEMAK